MRSFKSETDIFKSGSFAIFRSIIPIVFSPALYPLKTYFGQMNKVNPIAQKLKKPIGICFQIPVEIFQPAMKASPFQEVSHL